jgi:YkoY family integral membrane protein
MLWGINGDEWLIIARNIATLVFLEGLLSADNALVLAVMVRHLPKAQQKRALRYGIWGAFFFRFIAVLLATTILDYWQFEVVGGVYLLYLAIRHFALGEGENEPHSDVSAEDLSEAMSLSGEMEAPDLDRPEAARPSAAPPAPKRGFWASVLGRGFWATVFSVEMADIAFSIDSILAAVALADEMPIRLHKVMVGFFSIKDWTIYAGGVLGIIMMRYVAGFFLILLDRFKGLAAGAYLLVGWIGLKLIGSGFHHALFHPMRQIVVGVHRIVLVRVPGGWRDSVPDWIAHHLDMPGWFFWGGMLLIVFGSMIYRPKESPRPGGPTEQALDDPRPDGIDVPTAASGPGE